MPEMQDVYVDFDHTLLDTDDVFFGELYDEVVKIGCSDEQWLRMYETLGAHGLTSRALAELAPIGMPDNTKRAVAAIMRDRLEDLSPFVFPDVLPFLNRVRTLGGRAVVVTRGERAWQEQKVVASGLSPYLHGILTIDCGYGKSNAIACILSAGRRAIFVDNNPRELQEVGKELPDVEIYAINRVPNSAMCYSTPKEERRWLRAREFAFGLSDTYPVVKTLGEIVL